MDEELRLGCVLTLSGIDEVFAHVAKNIVEKNNRKVASSSREQTGDTGGRGGQKGTVNVGLDLKAGGGGGGANKTKCC